MNEERRPSNQHRPSVDREGPIGLRFGMFATCVVRDGAEDLRGKPKELYTVLVTFADTEGRDTDKGYPYRTVLAKALGCSTKTVDRATDALEEIGLVTVHQRKLPGSSENDANRYELHDGWLIHGVEPSRRVPARLVARYGHHIRGFDVAAFLEGGGDTSVSTPRDMGDATGRDTGVPQSRAGSPEPSSRDGDAPSARSAPDGRRPSTPSRTRAKGGSAASGKNSTSLTPAQGKLVAAVLRELPEALRGLLPEKLPRAVKTAVLEGLAVGTPHDRTPQQLVAYRVAPKWWKHYAGLHAEGKLERPVGAFIRMLARDKECGNDRCDERVDVDLEEPCRFCQTAREDRKAGKGSQRPEERPYVPSQPGASARGECTGCGNPIILDPEVGDRLCKECRNAPQALENAGSAVEEEPEWEPTEADLEAAWSALLEEAYAENDRRCRAEAEERQRIRAEEQRQRDEATEAARLREEIARQYPELAAVSSGPPPF